jgi:hypothetical protein
MITFKAFIENPGTDVLEDWYAAHPAEHWLKLWARYYTIWLYLRQQPIGGWREPYFHLFTGKGGIGRIGFDFKRIAYRHIGFFGPQRNEFTIVFAAEEHDWDYMPRGCIDTAVTRMKLATMDGSRLRIATIRTPPENV